MAGLFDMTQGMTLPMAPGQSPDAGGAGTQPAVPVSASAATPPTPPVGTPVSTDAPPLSDEAKKLWDMNTQQQYEQAGKEEKTSRMLSGLLTALGVAFPPLLWASGAMRDKANDAASRRAAMVKQVEASATPVTGEQTPEKADVLKAQAEHFRTQSSFTKDQMEHPEKYKQTNPNPQTPIEVAKVNAGASKYRSDAEIKARRDIAMATHKDRLALAKKDPKAVIAAVLDKASRGEDTPSDWEVHDAAVQTLKDIAAAAGTGIPGAPATKNPAAERLKAASKNRGAVGAIPPEVAAAFLKNPKGLRYKHTDNKIYVKGPDGVIRVEGR